MDKKAYNDAYYERNKEIISKNRKERRSRRKDGFFTVYYLPEEAYVGMTDHYERRL